MHDSPNYWAATGPSGLMHPPRTPTPPAGLVTLHHLL